MRLRQLIMLGIAMVGCGLFAQTRPAIAQDVACVAACGVTAEQAYHACVAQGMPECGAVAHQTMQTCVAACPAPPTECPARCEASAAELQSVCLAACTVGDLCAGGCQELHDTALARCMTEFCNPTGPACTADARSCCLEDCGGVARGVFASCITAGGDPARPACEAHARDALARCAADQCGVVPEVSCEDRCTAMAASAVAHCVAAPGSSADACRTMGAQLRQDCLDVHCAEAGPTCAEKCQDSAEGAFHDCIAGGGLEHDCATDAQAQRDACLTDQCGGPEPDCPTRCQDAVGHLVATCKASGLSDPAFCDARGDEALRHCVDDHCVDAPAPDPSCEEQCADHAKLDTRRCIESGAAAEADCTAGGQDEFQGCVLLHCSPAEACVARCDKRAARARRRCTEGGGGAATCDAAAARVQDRCLADRCAPTPPDTCDADCEVQATSVEASCLAALDPNPDACNAAKQAALDECTAGCGLAADVTCSEDCEAMAQDRHDAVLARTGDADRATRKARRTYRRCVGMQCGG